MEAEQRVARAGEDDGVIISGQVAAFGVKTVVCWRWAVLLLAPAGGGSDALFWFPAQPRRSLTRGGAARPAAGPRKKACGSRATLLSRGVYVRGPKALASVSR